MEFSEFDLIVMACIALIIMCFVTSLLEYFGIIVF